MSNGSSSGPSLTRRTNKVSPAKALWHKKLGDQKEVRRVYDEVESHDERLELNTYIVGESGGEEEE